ncbi:MAG: CHAP domain-containing protein [Leucobacter sp.]
MNTVGAGRWRKATLYPVAALFVSTAMMLAMTGLNPAVASTTGQEKGEAASSSVDPGSQLVKNVALQQQSIHEPVTNQDRKSNPPAEEEPEPEQVKRGNPETDLPETPPPDSSSEQVEVEGFVDGTDSVMQAGQAAPVPQDKDPPQPEPKPPAEAEPQIETTAEPKPPLAVETNASEAPITSTLQEQGTSETAQQPPAEEVPEPDPTETTPPDTDPEVVEGEDPPTEVTPDVPDDQIAPIPKDKDPPKVTPQPSEPAPIPKPAPKPKPSSQPAPTSKHTTNLPKGANPGSHSQIWLQEAPAPAKGLIGDDYPSKYKMLPAFPMVPDEWNFYHRQCTSFVAWRLVSANKVPFSNSSLGVPSWGNAGQWGEAARQAGFRVDMNPAVGSVGYSLPNHAGASPYGHVVWVAQVLDDGRIVVEEYNYGSPAGHYHARTVPKETFSGFIHIRDLVAPPTPSGPPSTATPVSSTTSASVEKVLTSAASWLTESELALKLGLKLELALESMQQSVPAAPLQFEPDSAHSASSLWFVVLALAVPVKAPFLARSALYGVLRRETILTSTRAWVLSFYSRVLTPTDVLGLTGFLIETRSSLRKPMHGKTAPVALGQPVRDRRGSL